jgi:hypothetical protein
MGAIGRRRFVAPPHRLSVYIGPGGERTIGVMAAPRPKRRRNRAVTLLIAAALAGLAFTYRERRLDSAPQPSWDK